MKVFKRIIFCFIIFTSLLLVFLMLKPNFTIYNNTINVGDKYIPNIKVYNLFADMSDKISYDKEISTEKIGYNSLGCSVKYLGITFKETIDINVIDSEKPLINLKGNNPALVCPNGLYEEEGFEVVDNYDKNLDSKVNINQDINDISYTVSDSSGNTNTIVRQIVYEDKEAPIITLNGGEYVTIYLGNNYVEKGVTAKDNCDGDITGNVLSTGYVDVNNLGSYQIKYEVSDKIGNTSSVVRTVRVISKPNYYGNGAIYLTFDDGSSYLTSRVLDILKEEGILATFFVVKVDANTKRAYDEGHSIGLHTYSHNYSYIYSNSDNYFNDLNNISNAVYNMLGIRTNIIRFPGGSSNTVSRNYNSGIMSYLTSEVTNRGYAYFDWNVDSNDAGEDIRNSSRIYYNVISNLSFSKTNIVLMHDCGGHEATVNALRDIINYGKNNGYKFDKISMDTPKVVHAVNN